MADGVAAGGDPRTASTGKPSGTVIRCTDEAEHAEAAGEERPNQDGDRARAAGEGRDHCEGREAAYDDSGSAVSSYRGQEEPS